MALDTLSLAGKVAIVTGSGRENGIGGGIARTLARNGAAVTLNYVSEKSTARAEEVAQSIRDLGARVAVVRASVATQEGASKIVSETLEAFGVDHIDILGVHFIRAESQNNRTFSFSFSLFFLLMCYSE